MEEMQWPSAAVSVASPGPTSSPTRSGALGPKRSKEGADLAFTVADATHWAEQFGKEQTVLLQDPSTTELWSVVDGMAADLRKRWAGGVSWGGEVGFFFSGHGTQQGEIVLSDGTISVVQLIDRLGAAVPEGAGNRLKLGVALDCCYAGAALVDAVLRLPETVSLRDALGSSLHDELSYEYVELGHGLFTYVMKQAPETLDDTARWLRDVLTRHGWEIDGDKLVPPKDVPATSPLLVPGLSINERFANTVIDLRALPYLSDGDQTGLDIWNSHLVTVSGYGDIDLADGEVTSQQLRQRIEDICRRNELDLGVYFPN